MTPPPETPATADLIVCSYNRFEELTLSLPSMLREAGAAADRGIETTVTIVYQNHEFPKRLEATRPDLAKNPLLRLVFSSVPGLTRARNIGLANTAGDIAIFVDDDVILKPGFIAGHVDILTRYPHAVGTVGRIESQRDRGQVNWSREIGQIRASGLISPNFNSRYFEHPVVAGTPMGANMSYRRSQMNGAFGSKWFDETLTGTAFREETTLALRCARLGLYFLFAPKAELFHFESARGGCGNRTEKTLAQLVAHYALDHLYLRRLYGFSSIAAATGPWVQLYRDLKDHPTLSQRIKKAYVNVRGYFRSADLLRREGQLQTVEHVQPQLRVVSAESASEVQDSRVLREVS